MTAAFTMPARWPHLRVAILSSDPLRRSALSAVVADLGHETTTYVGDADVVIADESVPHPAHPAVIRLGNLDDREAAGVLPRQASVEQIGAAVQALAVGLSVRARDLVSEGFAAAVEPTRESLLTPREIEVLAVLAEGLSNKAIARKLDISQHTVKFHVESLFRKLGVRSRSQAVIKGLNLMSRTRLDI